MVQSLGRESRQKQNSSLPQPALGLIPQAHPAELLRKDVRELDGLAAALAEVGHHDVDGVAEDSDATLGPGLDNGEVPLPDRPGAG